MNLRYALKPGVDKRRTDKKRTADRGWRTADGGRRTAEGGPRTTDGGAFYIHMITTATNYNTLYYIHFEINGVSCNLIGSQECDFSTNRTAIRAEIALL